MPPIAYVLVVQVSAMFVTFAPAMFPTPFVTVQACPGGFVSTVTAYGAPLPSVCANANVPLAATARSSPPLFWSTAVPVRPLAVPPTVY